MNEVEVYPQQGIFLIHCFPFLSFIVLLFMSFELRGFIAVAVNINEDNEVWTMSSTMHASHQELEETLFVNFDQKRAKSYTVQDDEA